MHDLFEGRTKSRKYGDHQFLSDSMKLLVGVWCLIISVTVTVIVI